MKTYISIDNSLVNKVERITLTDYRTKIEEVTNIIEAENLKVMVEDLLCEVYRLQDKIEDIKQNVEDNYTRKGFEY